MTISMAGARAALLAGLLPLSAFTVALSVASIAQAQQQTPPAQTVPPPAPVPVPVEPATDPDALPPGLAAMDENDDKAVDQKEFVTFQLKTYDRVDADKNGMVTREEYLKQAEPPFVPADAPNLPPLDQRRRVLNNQFTALDANQDGSISREEAEQAFVREFVVLDRDRNSRITANDARVARAQEQASQRPEQITKADFLEGEAQLFIRLDVNTDEALSQEEFMALANGAPADQEEQIKARLTAAFAEIDANKDKKLAKDEWLAFTERNFARVDRNNDGVLTQDELNPQQAAAPAPAPAAPAEITREQFVENQVNGAFAQFDKNKDGKITVEEFSSMAGSKDDKPRAGEPTYQQKLEMVRQTFATMDKNKNKTIERSEMSTHWTTIFNRIDTDKNGKLTQKEMDAASAAGNPGAARPQARPAPAPAAKPPAAKPPAARPAPRPQPAPQPPAPQPAPQGGPPPAFPTR